MGQGGTTLMGVHFREKKEPKVASFKVLKYSVSVNCLQYWSDLFSSLSISPLYFILKSGNLLGTEASWWGSRSEHHTYDLVLVLGTLSVAPQLTG